MAIQELIPANSLLFAPMEGVTDAVYRQVLLRIYPQWSRFSTDFLRVPSEGHYPESKIIKHFGEQLYSDPIHRRKTTYQILTSPKANTAYTVEQINNLGFEHLDLNLGCPSKVVNKNQGGAYLLSNPLLLAQTLKLIRKHFKNHFTVKIRTGYLDTSLFSELIHIIEEEGAEAITLHGRTKVQAYKGKADWSFIKRAVEESSLPIIGNGDLWEIDDVNSMKRETGCHAFMIARGALKTPWFAKTYQEHLSKGKYFSEPELLSIRENEIQTYFEELSKAYSMAGLTPANILKRFKSLSHYLFDDFYLNPNLKTLLLRSQELQQFIDCLYSKG